MLPLLNFSMPNEAFGDIKKLLTQEFVRQCYLEVTRQPNTEPPVSEFRWGQRAFLETSKENILNFVSQVSYLFRFHVRSAHCHIRFDQY